MNLAVLMGEKGDQEAKAELSRQAIQESEAGDFKDVLIAAVNNLGVVYHDQGEYDRSLQYIRRALEIMANQPVQDKQRMGSLHSNMAVMLRLDRNQEAFRNTTRPRNWRAAMRPWRSISGSTAAPVSVHGQSARALEEYRGFGILRKSPLRTDAIRTNAGYAQGLQGVGQSQDAVGVAEKALKEAKGIGDPDLVWTCLSPLGDSYLSLGKREEARASFLEAIAAVESIKLSGGQDEQDNFFHEKAVPYHGMVRLLVEDGKIFEALQYAERAKARLLLDVLRGSRAEIVRAMSETEKQKERELSAAIASIDSQLARQKGAAPAELLARRTQSTIALDQFHAALYAAHPELRTARRISADPAGAGRRTAARRGYRAVGIHCDENAVYLFAIARDAAGAASGGHQLRDVPGLTRADRALPRAARRSRPGYRAAARRYTRVLGPASTMLRRKKRLVIVPDGPLWNLPFQALVSPQGRYLVEDAAVFYVPSLTAAREMLTLPRVGTDSSHTLLALGGPGEAGSPGGLPEAQREVRQIGELYGARFGKVLAGDQADKQQWKSLAPGYQILHLATHGVLNGNNPLYSYLVMNRAPGAREESMLSAREILGMNLQADVTVLSACETARGKFRYGEGLIGMSWAFLVAGTPTTVVSQWKVDSASTSKLMVAFHRNLKAGARGRAEGLRGAVLQLLRTPEYSHPFYWAGFVMVGNGY